jgi:hypothetical protein
MVPFISPSPILDLTRRLSRDAEAVCRYYLPNGSRQGRHWIVGDVRNTPGSSMFVRLLGPDTGRGAAGKWTDAATGEHGDLLDIIAARSGYDEFRLIVDEAKRFLRLPRTDDPDASARTVGPMSIRSSDAAFRLFAMARPIAGSPVETYLRARHIDYLDDVGSLRFHPRCYYRPSYGRPSEAWPAMIASVTDHSGILTGVHRTWLDRSGLMKAPIRTPRRAMGNLLGNAVRFGVCDDVLAAGEGIETMLSLRSVMPTMPMAAALSAAHLSALLFPPGLRRLYIARDNDPAGDGAVATLRDRAMQAGIEAIWLSPQLGDFNEDLRLLGLTSLRSQLPVQLSSQDIDRFMPMAA